jgi:hypothetical protein
LIELMTVQGYRTGFGVVIGRSFFRKERAMRRTIVALMVVAGMTMAMAMAGCGPSADENAPKHPAGMPTTTPQPPAEKAPAQK